MFKFIHVILIERASIFLEFNSIIHLIYHFPCLQARFERFSRFGFFYVFTDICIHSMHEYLHPICVCAHYLYLDNYVVSSFFGKFPIQIDHFPCTMQHTNLASSVLLCSILCFFLSPLFLKQLYQNFRSENSKK